MSAATEVIVRKKYEVLSLTLPESSQVTRIRDAADMKRHIKLPVLEYSSSGWRSDRR